MKRHGRLEWFGHAEEFGHVEFGHVEGLGM